MEPNPSNISPIAKSKSNRDFLIHLESYLAKRDGVDKLLKIIRYTTNLIISSNSTPQSHLLQLKSFESSIALTRKSFRIGKFIQNINAFRSAKFNSKYDIFLSTIAYWGEGSYYFIEQFVWLTKSGLFEDKHSSRRLQKISAWCELIGYIGSVCLKFKDLMRIFEDEVCLRMSIEIAVIRGEGRRSEEMKLKKLTEKKLLKRMELVQDLADGLMAVADIRDGKGRLSAPVLVASAGLLSAVISAHKNWVSC